MSIAQTENGIHMVDELYAVYRIVGKLSVKGVGLEDVANDVGVTEEQVQEAFQFYEQNELTIHADILREQLLQARDQLETRATLLSQLDMTCTSCRDGVYEPVHLFPSNGANSMDERYGMLECSSCGDSPTWTTIETPLQDDQVDRRFVDFDTGEFVYQLTDGRLVDSSGIPDDAT